VIAPIRRRVGGIAIAAAARVIACSTTPNGSTLQYANRAKSIRNKPRRNEVRALLAAASRVCAPRFARDSKHAFRLYLFALITHGRVRPVCRTSKRR
jgi:hypothetical protein